MQKKDIIIIKIYLLLVDKSKSNTVVINHFAKIILLLYILFIYFNSNLIKYDFR